MHGDARGDGGMREDVRDFEGAKIAVIVGERVLALLRDDRADLPWPGHWDLPGGGREGGETPRTARCAS